MHVVARGVCLRWKSSERIVRVGQNMSRSGRGNRGEVQDSPDSRTGKWSYVKYKDGAYYDGSVVNKQHHGLGTVVNSDGTCRPRHACTLRLARSPPCDSVLGELEARWPGWPGSAGV